MKFVPLSLLVFAASSHAIAAAQNAELARMERHARAVTIVRDDWGIAHISGKTDADAVFGALYTQAEDDFNRVETNYLNAMGRLAEAEGESAVFQDLRMKLFIDPAQLQKQYAASPVWLQTLMTAFADGLNYYLAKHPETKPRVIRHFEPWMALSFTEGSIGGDIERVNLTQLEGFYGNRTVSHMARVAAAEPMDPEPRGSNGIAVAPARTAGHHALLLINPHTSFFFRSELQMTSKEGLNAYGAVTWGQFFIYQGFNERAGWMHTSSGVDAVDEYLETITKQGEGYTYKYGTGERPVTARQITVPYRSASGMAERKFTVYATHHGPVTHEVNGKWVSIQLMQKPIEALTQSYVRTKATTYKAFLKTMDLLANSSNNTIFADADGNIAYFHGNFIPRRDTAFDFTKAVDGANPATDWHGIHAASETPQLFNPASGWLYNTNNWPWSGAGASSLKKSDFPAYVENGTESARGLHAIRVLKDKTDFTLDSLISAAYDSYLPWFQQTVPALIKAFDSLPPSDPRRAQFSKQLELLRAWNLRWSETSVETSLAVFWGEEIRRQAIADARRAGVSVEEYISSRAPAEQLLHSLAAASDRLTADFGSWNTPWGSINRFQRLTGDIVQPFDDKAPSIPVAFPSAVWGSLASFGARPSNGTKKWYGTSGNSFVAAVEFGPKVRAKAVTAGGESGHPGSPHFNDEARRYSTGQLRDVYFYPSQLKGHTERVYHP